MRTEKGREIKRGRERRKRKGERGKKRKKKARKEEREGGGNAGWKRDRRVIVSLILAMNFDN